MALKILTLNIHGYQEENQLEKFDIIADNIAANNYDIIALQEVSQTEENEPVFVREDDPTQTMRANNPIYIIGKRLKEKYGIEYFSHWVNIKMGFVIYQEGIAIMSKLPIIKGETIVACCDEYNDMKDSKRRALAKTKLDYNGTPINIYSIHFGLASEAKNPFILQFTKLHEDIKKNGDELTIFLGDFNIPDYSDEYQKILEHGYTDLYETAKTKSDQRATIAGFIHGWESNDKPLRIDFGFSNRALDVESADVVFTKEKYGLVSDHYGIEFKINI
ncbi:MAG: endonuclease/exonuclease/phosphatase family protein [Leptotrichiaceae bacterium]|jgi:maltose 6'-phosphate phosphatase|nr:hypothetical protein [Leptotrichiaceae bacterium]MBP6167774.1 hypothetical protein [Leptotrichiaceae bacterium]MBP7025709.1 hypothetical protein [Leptotrichiaceae bacterium]MBP8636466.1 hypothetical protein [Leptotrichiaceae bacterium]MBP9538315.1 hypothetical protein [Leptotrichiaceae bacterium]